MTHLEIWEAGKLLLLADPSQAAAVLLFDISPQHPLTTKQQLHGSCRRETLPGGVDVVFCSDQSADSWLVREAGKLQKEGKTPQVR